ncbi:hypothetical protein [Campylobacter sp. US33a]|uniref:hypothetical protein n=1 Tax=Campylobacter sp. US33a TaxID=2498120 RepID=UPI0010674F59|nr:hypothetical protein [Campylobacter sp. US33a]
MFKKILSFFLLSAQILFGADALEEEASKVYREPSNVITGERCEFRCRKVAEKYGTQIVGFNIPEGITHCVIFEKNDHEKVLKFNADTKNLACQTDLAKRNPQLFPRGEKTEVKSQIKQVIDDNEITLSRFLTSIATLNPEIIDREKTALTGQLELQPGVNPKGSIANLFSFENDAFGPAKELANALPLFSFDKTAQPVTSGERISIADGFNKSNLAYFSNLYNSMSFIYTHLQNLIFIIVGGFYLSIFGGKKLLSYLQNGENDPNDDKKYLERFSLPFIMTIIFFAPIPEGKAGDVEMQATPFQKIIRFATNEANNIADLASAQGANTYMNKLYSSVGGISQEGEKTIKNNLELAKFTNEKAIEIYNEKCSERFAGQPAGIPFTNLTEQEKKDLLEKWDLKQVAGTENDISLQACVALQNQIYNTKSDVVRYSKQIQAIEQYLSSNELGQKLSQIDHYIANRELEFGWINSTLLPGTGLMVQFQDFMSDNVIQNDEEMEEITKKGQEATIDAVKSGEIDSGGSQDGLLRQGVAFAIGNLAYFILPGSGAVYDFFYDAIEKIGEVLGFFISNIVSIVGTPASGLIAKYGVKTVFALLPTSVFATWFTAMIMELVLQNLPVLVATVAGAVAFIAYLVTLTKYFYISPFVIAFSLGTKRVDKIVHFLITGMTIFFRPILIVLFVYLALFLNTLIKELFVLVSVEQFGALKVAGEDLTAIIIIETVKGILKILGYLAGSYIMWKTIIGGPDWVFRMIGIDNQTSDVVTDGINNRLEQKSFMV